VNPSPRLHVARPIRRLAGDKALFRPRRPWLATLYLLLVTVAPAWAAQAPAPRIQSPADYFHHAMGADRKLVSYDEALPYLEYLAGASDRVELDRIGSSTLGRDLVMLRISTPDNLANASHYKEI